MNNLIVKLSILNDESGDFPASYYAQQLSQAILDLAPPDTKIDRVPSNPEDMNLGENLLIGVGGSLIASAIVEGCKWLHNKYNGRVRVQLVIGDKRIMAEGTVGDLSALLAELAKNQEQP
jgi:hypothetical protein